MQTHSPTLPIVLVVKDDEAVLQLIVDLLEPEGYKIFAADSARRALDLTRTVRADLILSDIVMPEMNGLELCQRLKTDPETATVPVMLVSDYPEAQAQAVAIGALQGFGKSQLQDADAIERFRQALGLDQAPRS